MLHALLVLAVGVLLQSAPPARPAGPAARPASPAAPAAPAPGSQGRPSAGPIAVEPPVIDFGPIGPGSRHEGKFQLRNLTQQPLTVRSAMPSCKCTAVSPIVGKVIPAGGTLELSATLEAPRTPGDKDAKVFVVCDGMESPAVAMLKGVVTLPIVPEPAYCEALKGVTKGVVRLKATDAKPFTVLGCDGKPPVFVGFDPAKDQPRSEYILAWDFTGVAPADLKLWWVVETNRADCPLIPLRVRNENTGSKFDQARTGRFWHVPESLVSAGLLAPGQPFEGSVEIEHYNPKARGAVEKPEWSQVRGVKSLSPLATAEFLGSQMDGDKCAIRFRFTPSAAAAGRFIWVPMEIQTATGSGPFFVVASVRAPAGSAVPSK